MTACIVTGRLLIITDGYIDSFALDRQIDSMQLDLTHIELVHVSH